MNASRTQFGIPRGHLSSVPGATGSYRVAEWLNEPIRNDEFGEALARAERERHRRIYAFFLALTILIGAASTLLLLGAIQ